MTRRSYDIPAPDGPMSPQQQAVADSLSADHISQIDAALLSHARLLNRKVAMLVGLAMQDASLRVAGLPDIFFAQRVRALVEKGALVSEGNLDYMGFSEVRLPSQGDS